MAIPERTMKLSPHTEKIPKFTEEVERAIKRMKRHNVHGMDKITSYVLKLGGKGGGVKLIISTYLTYTDILKTKQIPDSSHEAKIVIVFIKGDPKDIKNYRLVSLVSHSYKIVTRLLQTRMKELLMKPAKRASRIPKSLFYIRPSASP